MIQAQTFFAIAAILFCMLCAMDFVTYKGANNREKAQDVIDGMKAHFCSMCLSLILWWVTR